MYLFENIAKGLQIKSHLFYVYITFIVFIKKNKWKEPEITLGARNTKRIIELCRVFLCISPFPALLFFLPRSWCLLTTSLGSRALFLLVKFSQWMHQHEIKRKSGLCIGIYFIPLILSGHSLESGSIFLPTAADPLWLLFSYPHYWFFFFL